MERGGGDYRWGVVKIPMPEWGRFPAPLPAAWQLRNADLERRFRGKGRIALPLNGRAPDFPGSTGRIRIAPCERGDLSATPFEEF